MSRLGILRALCCAVLATVLAMIQPWGGPYLFADLFQGAQAQAADPSRFLAGFDDLPLAPGLSEVPGAATLFEGPQGRLGEAYARGNAGIEAVRDFYKRTLPQLGWSLQKEGAYRREGEKLIIEIAADGKIATVRFVLSSSE